MAFMHLIPKISAFVVITVHSLHFSYHFFRGPLVRMFLFATLIAGFAVIKDADFRSTFHSQWLVAQIEYLGGIVWSVVWETTLQPPYTLRIF